MAGPESLEERAGPAPAAAEPGLACFVCLLPGRQHSLLGEEDVRVVHGTASGRNLCYLLSGVSVATPV